MAKVRTVYVCSSCGREEPRWLGCCPACGEWNTLREFHPDPGSKTVGFMQAHKKVTKPELLSTVSASPPEQYPTGLAEIDRVLGGGLVPGTAILLGGEPGIGKSTLMLQVAEALKGRGLYVSGEESAAQIKARADRLGIAAKNLFLLTETSLDTVMKILQEQRPDYVIADSVQTLFSNEAGTVPGSSNQLRMTTYRLINWAKTNEVPLFLIAHVTKEGIIAGPKVIEHLVDTVLYFDHVGQDLRILRASKNRMGSTDEMGLFLMGKKGLLPVTDPSAFFLMERKGKPPPGSAVAAVYEGSRILLVEIQALVIPAKGGLSRVYSDRIDSSRVSRVAAVLERHTGLKLSDQDLYVNVAGGLRINDVGAELALALALFSARTAKSLPANLIAVGELTLAGEVRRVAHLRRRLKTASDAGLTLWIAAPDSAKKSPPGGRKVVEIREALAMIADQNQLDEAKGEIQSETWI